MFGFLSRDLRKRHVEALQMLRDRKVKKYDEVWTADHHQIGTALRLHHRQENVNPDLKQYGSYLEVQSIELGGPAYIPTDFIDDYVLESGKVILSVKLATVQSETWNRTPRFVIAGKGAIEELA